MEVSPIWRKTKRRHLQQFGHAQQFHYVLIRLKKVFEFIRLSS